jgi:hypothetical protein
VGLSRLSQHERFSAHAAVCRAPRWHDALVRSRQHPGARATALVPHRARDSAGLQFPTTSLALPDLSHSGRTHRPGLPDRKIPWASG